MAEFNILNINITKKVISNFFHNKVKLFSLKDEEIESFRGLWDVEVMYIFNNKTWEEIFETTDYLSQTNYLVDTYPMLYAPMEFYRKKTGESGIDINMENIYFYFTGLFYMWAIVEINDTSLRSHLYTITRFLDPKDPYCEYIMYDPPFKEFFPSLIERYTPQQLFLISILFVELQKHIEISELGIKYWTWIYENTDDDIRKEIIKEFEESS